MANWFHRFFNPHCPDCVAERQDKRVCMSCDVLQNEIAILRNDNQRLLNRLLEKPEVENRSEAPEPKLPLPNRIPWKTRQQQLELKDREEAVARKLAASAPKTDVTDLERELEVVSQEREEKSGA